jgi:putative sporulation protein YyaC
MVQKKYYHVNDCHTQNILIRTLFTLIQNINKDYKKIIIVCIGNNHNMDDCYGPLTGHMLSKLKNHNFELYGTLRSRVHAADLPTIIPEKIRSDSLIIAIDAFVGENNENAGCIRIGYGSIKPGNAYGEGFPPIGDIFIAGYVLRKEKPYLSFVEESMPATIYDMAEKTTRIIKEAIKQVNLECRCTNIHSEAF